MTVASGTSHRKTNQPVMFIELTPASLIEFTDCTEGPCRIVSRIFYEGSAPLLTMDVSFISNSGAVLETRRHVDIAISHVAHLALEQKVLPISRCTAFRLGLDIVAPPGTSTIILEIIEIPSRTFIETQFTRIQTQDTGRTCNFSDALALYLVDDKVIEWYFPFPFAHRRPSDTGFELRFPDSAGDTAASLTLVGRDSNEEAHTPLVDQAVDTLGRALYSVQRARRIDRPRRQVKYVYYSPEVEYFECTLSLVNPAGIAFFDMDQIRCRQSRCRAYEKETSDCIDLASNRIFKMKRGSPEDLLRLVD